MHIWGSHSGCPFVVLEVEKLKTVAVEKARENFEKAKEKAEALRAKLDAAEKHLKRCEAVLIESENAEYVRIVREMNISIAELREIRKGRMPMEVFLDKTDEEDIRKNDEDNGAVSQDGEKKEGQEDQIETGWDGESADINGEEMV